jgi:polynucleotide 5'-kinase involved in rRNA processing
MEGEDQPAKEKTVTCLSAKVPSIIIIGNEEVGKTYILG